MGFILHPSSSPPCVCITRSSSGTELQVAFTGGQVIHPTLCSWDVGCVCAECSQVSHCWKLML